ncbi:MAG: hypothetical protein IOMNBAOH_02473 [Rhodocyclaceae bacterium]|nr:hypothetical protein [Rhodocyclaceae bacterium]
MITEQLACPALLARKLQGDRYLQIDPTEMIYQAYQLQMDLLEPAHELSRQLSRHLGACLSMRPVDSGVHSVTTHLAAASEVFGRLRLTHERPDYRIPAIRVGDREFGVEEKVIAATPFGTLLRFRRESDEELPRVLLVAPMSGHFATLLRETVRVLLNDHEVYATDWHNARDIPLTAGAFGLDDYVDHLIDWMARLGPNAHMIAVCQPCAAALAAAAIMAADGHPAEPASLTLMAGPVDASINPTRVNELATSKPIEWFERSLIGIVPARYRGALRQVYPGFVQLTAFMSMNIERHRSAFRDLYDQLVAGDHDRAAAIAQFYEEYFAVADLPAEFYLETVTRIFQNYELARRRFHHRGRRVDTSAIRRMALLTIEGERDDICAVGQTVAAHDLCDRLRPYRRAHHVQTGVGHYGVFSGRRWEREIYPRVRDVIQMSRR